MISFQTPLNDPSLTQSNNHSSINNIESAKYYRIFLVNKCDNLSPKQKHFETFDEEFNKMSILLAVNLSSVKKSSDSADH